MKKLVVFLLGLLLITPAFASWQDETVKMSYPYNKEEARKVMMGKFPSMSDKTAEDWLESGKLDSVVIGFETRYFEGFIDTMEHIDLSLLHQDKELMARYRELYLPLKKLIEKKTAASPCQPFVNPVEYTGKASAAIPRDKLPKDGYYQVWIPTPILTAAQTNARVLSVWPREYANLPATIDRDLGTIYLDIPLEKIKDDLEIGIEFAFTHYEQRFAIDPEKVGQYDTNSDLYKQYTASTGNTIISDPMADTARKIVGDETNPYLMARKIYDHVVDETTYSHVPHAALPILDYPESKYVFEKRYGDCGAQSMYFSALCRSVGIPARTTGGFQMIGGETGSHFWAEFYLPNYGWLPVDTSVAQLYKYLPEMSKKEQQDYKDFFFGNLDPYRYVIQKDVDLVPSPPPSEKLFFPMVFQLPEVVCRSYTADQIPGLELIEAWKTEVNRVE